MNNKKARVIAYYLPQYHPIKENDIWWGKGFTEWTNVGKAKKLFHNHYQPRIPADLGYYDLRLPEVREAQASMAQEYGIEGFCYWHYWFGNGKRLLEMPFNEVLRLGKPDFPFCLAWANESWKGFSHGLKDDRKILIEQKYPGMADYIAHFNTVMPAFKDKRYIKIRGNPIFVIYHPDQIPDANLFISIWQKLAKENKIGKIHFVAHCWDYEEVNRYFSMGFDAVNVNTIPYAFEKGRNILEKCIQAIESKYFNIPKRMNYSKAIKYFNNKKAKNSNIYPTIITGWDHTPRSGSRGSVFTNESPDIFEKHAKEIIDTVKEKDFIDRIIFLKSWNEWGEGNYIEPDLKFGTKYLEALKNQIYY